MTILKSIVICLALANVSYFLWAHGIADPPPPPPPSVPTLKLAAEAPRLVPAAPLAAVPDAEVAPDSATPASPAAGVDAAVAAPALGLGGAAAGLPASAGAGSTSVVAAPKRCISMGPFRDVSEATHAATRLRAVGYDPRQRAVEGEVWAGVWVYLPIPSAASAAPQLMATLKSGGIDDALEMPGPGDGSVMSLGLFSDQKRAQSRIVQAESLGFTPQVVDRKRAATIYWIDVDLKPSDNSLNPADIQAETGRISRLEMRNCAAEAAP